MAFYFFRNIMIFHYTSARMTSRRQNGWHRPPCPSPRLIYIPVYILYIVYILFHFIMWTFSRLQPRSASLLSASDCGGKARALKFIYSATRKWRSIDPRRYRSVGFEKVKFIRFWMLYKYAFQCVFDKWLNIICQFCILVKAFWIFILCAIFIINLLIIIFFYWTYSKKLIKSKSITIDTITIFFYLVQNFLILSKLWEFFLVSDKRKIIFKENQPFKMFLVNKMQPQLSTSRVLYHFDDKCEPMHSILLNSHTIFLYIKYNKNLFEINCKNQL